LRRWPVGETQMEKEEAGLKEVEFIISSERKKSGNERTAAVGGGKKKKEKQKSHNHIPPFQSSRKGKNQVGAFTERTSRRDFWQEGELKRLPELWVS